MESFTQNQTDLILAVQNQDLDEVQRLLSSGAVVNSTDMYGQTALHWAAKEKSLEIVEALLAAGADPTLGDVDGDSPIDNAGKRGNSEISAALNRASKEKSSPAEGQASTDSSLWDRLRSWFSGNSDGKESAASVEFLREYQKPSRMEGFTNTYREYKARSSN